MVFTNSTFTSFPIDDSEYSMNRLNSYEGIFSTGVLSDSVIPIVTKI